MELLGPLLLILENLLAGITVHVTLTAAKYLWLP